MRLFLLLGLIYFTYAAEGKNTVFLVIFWYILCFILELCSFFPVKSRVLNAVKMVLMPPRAASVTLCAHTTIAVAKTMNPCVVLGVSLPVWFLELHVNKSKLNMWNVLNKTSGWETVLVAARGDTFPSYPEDDDEEANSTEAPNRSRSQHRILTPSPATFPEIFSLLTPASQIKDLTLSVNPTPEIATAARPTTQFRLTSTIKNPTTAPRTTSTSEPTPTKAKDPDAEVCSGRPFDSFMQLKNGSIYAFRGKWLTAKTNKNVNIIYNYFLFHLGKFLALI